MTTTHARSGFQTRFLVGSVYGYGGHALGDALQTQDDPLSLSLSVMRLRAPRTDDQRDETADISRYCRASTLRCRRLLLRVAAATGTAATGVIPLSLCFPPTVGRSVASPASLRHHAYPPRSVVDLPLPSPWTATLFAVVMVIIPPRKRRAIG